LCPKSRVLEFHENGCFWPVFDEKRLFLSKNSLFLPENGHFRHYKKEGFSGMRMAASQTGIFSRIYRPEPGT
jgi:hypothetical protein